MDEGDLHPIEIIAHSILNGPLENLNENFNLLHKSQVILLTRLKLIEDRLQEFQKMSASLGERDVSQAINRVQIIRKRLESIDKKLDDIDSRVI